MEAEQRIAELEAQLQCYSGLGDIIKEAMTSQVRQGEQLESLIIGYSGQICLIFVVICDDESMFSA